MSTKTTYRTLQIDLFKPITNWLKMIGQIVSIRQNNEKLSQLPKIILMRFKEEDIINIPHVKLYSDLLIDENSEL